MGGADLRMRAHIALGLRATACAYAKQSVHAVIMALAAAALRRGFRNPTGLLLSSGGICSRSSSTASGKIYEMRRYEVKPDKYAEFIRHGEKKYAELMMPHGKLLGYWASSLGSLNEVYHLWEYGR